MATTPLAMELAEFEQPPVIETVLGLQFLNLPLNAAHWGRFWETNADRWPLLELAPALEPEFEVFDSALPPFAPFRLLSGAPPLRAQFRNPSKDRMLQLQSDRVIYNWLGQPDQPYPRYRQVRPEFEEVVRQFNAFARRFGASDCQFNQWEITYVNDIPRGSVWDAPNDWSSVFPQLFSPTTETAAGGFESFGGEWHFTLPERRGRLHVSARHVKSATEPKEALRVVLTARGPVRGEPTSVAGALEGLDQGHEAIVRAFCDLSSAQAQTFWRRVHVGR